MTGNPLNFVDEFSDDERNLLDEIEVFLPFGNKRELHDYNLIYDARYRESVSEIWVAGRPQNLFLNYAPGSNERE